LGPNEQALDYVLAHTGYLEFYKLSSFVCHSVG
jgi:hypothetical protein